MARETPVLEKNGEKEIHVDHINIRQSVSILVFKLIAIEVITGILVVTFHTLLFSTGEESASFNLRLDLPNSLVYVSFILLKISLSIFVIFQWFEEYYEITPKLVIHRKGFIFKTEKKYSFQHIRALGLDQGIFGKIFNFGTINLFNWDLDQNVSLFLIHNPNRYLKILQELLPARDEEKKVVARHLEGED